MCLRRTIYMFILKNHVFEQMYMLSYPKARHSKNRKSQTHDICVAIMVWFSFQHNHCDKFAYIS